LRAVNLSNDPQRTSDTPRPVASDGLLRFAKAYGVTISKLAGRIRDRPALWSCRRCGAVQVHAKQRAGPNQPCFGTPVGRWRIFVDLEELGGNDLSGRFNQCGAQIDFEIAARLGGRLLRQASRTKGKALIHKDFRCANVMREMGREMKVGYARVSTDGQTLDAQQAAPAASGAERVFAEKVSGAVTDRKALAKAIAALGPGDVLLVTRLDRFRAPLAICSMY
jgi:Resolvase, N terminal domain